MLSLRSLAFILASAMRRARALSSASFNHLPDRKNGRQMDIKAPAKIAMKIPVSFMSLPCEQVILALFRLPRYGTPIVVQSSMSLPL